MELYEYTIQALHRKICAREFTSRQITEAVLARIEAVEPTVHAYITVLQDEALAQADAVDAGLASGAIEPTPLTGIPIAVKDVACTKGMLTTCGSRMLKNFLPPYNAAIIEKLRQHHAVLIGKTNMDEFAMGSSTENSAYHVTRNPWNPDYVPGGSSGGSAAAVAAGEAIAAIGSDTGGSIRQPAAFCNVTGLKPTYGRVSRYGLVAFASSLDQLGPIAKDAADAAILLQAISGHDPRDSTSKNLPVPDYADSFTSDLAGLRIGIPKEYVADGLDPEIQQAVQQAIATLERLGATCRDVSLPHTAYGIAAYYIIAPSEASSNLARYDGVKYGHRAATYDGLMDMYTTTRAEGFGDEVLRRIMIGTYALSSGYYDAYYLKAQKVRTLLRRDFEQAFKEVDVIAGPVTPTAPFKIGENVNDPLAMYLGDVFTVTVNLAGVAGMSVPCGFTQAGLPIGLQLIGGHFQEATILRAAHAFQQQTDFHAKTPNL